MPLIALATLLVFWCRGASSDLNVLAQNTLDPEQTERVEAVDDVSMGEAPSVVAIFCNNNKYYCSGTILHPEWVLTAAHCLYSLVGEFTEDDGTVTVLAGSPSIYFTKEDVQSGKVQVRQSKKVIVHNDYSWSESFINDLALIQVSKPFEMTARVSAANTSAGTPMEGAMTVVDYPGSGDLAKSETFRCSGYGYGKELRWLNTSSDNSLKVQEYEVSKHCHCMERIRSIRNQYSVVARKNMFICHIPGPSTGLCDGDGGGQLICSAKLRAVATTTIHYEVLKTCTSLRDRYNECGDRRSMSVFTDLCHFGPWLHKHVPNYPLHQDMCASAVRRDTDST